LSKIDLDFAYDPFVSSEFAESSSSLGVHYMTPLAAGDAVFMEIKSGTYSASTYATEAWGIVRFDSRSGGLSQRWQAMSDWKAVGGTADFWEPVFHGALANGHLYVPGAKGTILALDEDTGATVGRITPDASWDANTYVVSPITVDASGRLYFAVLRLPPPGPAVMRPPGEAAASNAAGGWTTAMPSVFYGSDALDSFLVRVGPAGDTKIVSMLTILPGAPRGTDSCAMTFGNGQLPWPPSADAVPPAAACGIQRVAINAAPAVAPDGTVYVVTRAHFSSRTAYLVALHADLTLKWSASLDERFDDGCGVPRAQGGQLPANGAPGGCRVGAPYGVDPATNRKGGGRVLDDSSASPVVAPDGSVFYGAATSYNYSQGHLMHFSAGGAYLGAYPFGWDATPAIYAHDGTYSVVTKDNHYGDMGSYCSDPTVCPTDRPADDPEAYFVTQLSPDMKVEWQTKATNQESCTRGDGGITCVSDHPHSFEWCVNAPAIDAAGTVYVNSEDGWLYAIAQGGTIRDKILQQQPRGGAYTPASLGPDGKVYSQNSGELFVIGH
jgi:outer membrane protein assembly factor BamB